MPQQIEMPRGFPSKTDDCSSRSNVHPTCGEEKEHVVKAETFAKIFRFFSIIMIDLVNLRGVATNRLSTETQLKSSLNAVERQKFRSPKNIFQRRNVLLQ